MSTAANANADGGDDPYVGSSRGPLDPIAVPSSWSAKGLALQAAATVSTFAYLKLRYETTFVDTKQPPSAAAALLLAAEAFAALRALCHLGPFNLRSREQYRDTADLLAANSYEGCHMRVLIPCYTESLDLVSTTAIASAAADLPRGMERTIYICDDGADPLKRMWCEDCDRKGTLGCPVRWVSGRSKTVPGNGKSLNFNYALRQIYGERAVDNNCGHGVASVGWKTVPDTEFVAGLDADMAPSPTFFTELVSRLRTPRDAFSQSAQAFWNYDPEADITDNAQLVKYEVCDSQVRAFGGVRCNGSGWVCRARAMAHAGWWRVDTTGEDQAMGIALERRGYKGYYTMKTLQIGEVPCTIEDTFVQKTRYAQNFWKNVCGRNGIIWDSSFSFRKRLTGQGLLRDSLTPAYVPVFVLAPVLALLAPSFASSPAKIVGWSPRLPWAWLVQYLLLQAVVLFNVAAVVLGPRKGREQRTSRSLVASWLTNLTSTHTFWFMISISAFKVLRAELKGSMLEFVVTPKTQSAREQEQPQPAGAAPRSPSSAPSIASLPSVAASIAARPSLYPDEYFSDGTRKSVLLPRATAAAGPARRASVAFAGAASGFGGGGVVSGGAASGSGRGRRASVTGRRSSVSPIMLEASIERCQSLARVMLLHVQNDKARKGTQVGASASSAAGGSSSAAGSSGAPAATRKAQSPPRSSFGLRGRQQGNDGDAAPAAPAVRTPFRVDSTFHAADGEAVAAAAPAAAAAAAGPLSVKRDGASKTIETLLSGGGATGQWRQVPAARRRAELQANAKKLRRWTSSLRIVHRPERGVGGAEGGIDGVDATAIAFEEGEPVPWEHVWVHALAGGLSLLASARGVLKVLLGCSVLRGALPTTASSSWRSPSLLFFARRQAAAAAPAAAALPAPQLLVFTAWAFVNAVPPVLLFVRTVKGDGLTLQKWWAVAPRAVFAVAGLALAGVLAVSTQQL